MLYLLDDHGIYMYYGSPHNSRTSFPLRSDSFDGPESMDRIRRCEVGEGADTGEGAATGKGAATGEGAATASNIMQTKLE